MFKRYPKMLLIPLCMLLLMAGAVVAHAHSDLAVSAAKWVIATHQNSDGGYTSFSQGADIAPSDIGGTVDAVIGLSATTDVPQVTIDYLTTHSDELAAYARQDAGSAGKAVMAIVALGDDPAAFSGNDLVAILQQQVESEGFETAGPFSQALALLGLAGAEANPPSEAVQTLLERQADTGELAGSWDDGFGTDGNPDATAMAVIALEALEDPAYEDSIEAAISFLNRVQIAGEGWEYGPGFGPNATSTALALQAFNAAGENVDLTPLLAWVSESGALQADLGSGAQDDFYTTIQGLPTLAGETLPLRPEVHGTGSEESEGLILPGWVGWALAGAALLLAFGASAWYRRSG